MSRRFGRNQKRRMREEIAQRDADLVRATLRCTELRFAYDREAALLRKVSKDNRELREVLQLARECLGENHVAFPPSEMELRYRDPSRRMQITQRESASSYFIEDNATMPVRDLVRMWKEAHIFSIDSEVFKAARWQQHFYLRYPGGQKCYAVTPEALRALPDDRLVREIAMRFATCVANEYRTNPMARNALNWARAIRR